MSDAASDRSHSMVSVIAQNLERNSTWCTPSRQLTRSRSVTEQHSLVRGLFFVFSFLGVGLHDYIFIAQFGEGRFENTA